MTKKTVVIGKRNEVQDRRSHDVRPGEADDVSLTRRNEQISLAAYLRAERRGFEPGHELEDWLASEAEIADASRVGRVAVSTHKQGP